MIAAMTFGRPCQNIMLLKTKLYISWMYLTLSKATVGLPESWIVFPLLPLHLLYHCYKPLSWCQSSVRFYSLERKAVNLHPAIDGFEVLLFTFWMNSFAFPRKAHYFFKYVTYLCTQRGLFSISAPRSSLSFTALLKQSFIKGILKSLT